MNRRQLSIVLLVVAADALFQWWQSTQILVAETNLRTELARLKEQKEPPPVPSDPAAPAAANTTPPEPEKFDPDKLVSDFIALVPLIRDARNKAPASTGDLEQRAMVIMALINVGPHSNVLAAETNREINTF